MNTTFGKYLLPVLLALVFFTPLTVNAQDFGLILNQRFNTSGGRGNTDIDYEAALVPRFSLLIGDYGDFFVSASLKAAYEDGWRFVPELLRTEFSWISGNSDFRLGRIMFSDPMGITAVGLFDGVLFSRHTMQGSFAAGLWYTGLLYRNRANIAMTEDDVAALNEELDWSRFSETYFASRRLMAALRWEHPSLAELIGLRTALIAQFDLNGRDSSHHSQYLIAHAVLPLGRFIFELGGAMGVAQVSNGGSSDMQVSFAGDAGMHWTPPAAFHSMVSFTGRFSSGRAESGPVSAFAPITALSHGEILQAEIPGLSLLRLGYAARLHRTFSAGLSATYFIRSDTVTYLAYPLNGASSNDHFLGAEFFCRIIWSPVSDMTLSLGAGAFLPSLGNVASDANALWRIEMALTLALR